MNKEFSRSFLANAKPFKKPSLNKSSQPFVSRSRPYSQASSIRAGGSVTSNDSINLDLLINNGEIFPEDVLILLGEEQRNINTFKQRIERQKLRIETDFNNFRREVDHTMQDLKISMQAELDRVYRYFIQKYAALKSQVQQVKKIKKQIETQAGDVNYEKNIPMNSNKQLIKELTKDSRNYRVYKIQNYITQLQKKRISPLLDLSKQIILLETSNRNYYDADASNSELNALKQQIAHFTSHMFNNLSKYITNPSLVFENNLADEISIMSEKKQDFQQYIPPKEYQDPEEFQFRNTLFNKDYQKDRKDFHRGNSKESREFKDPRQPRDPREYLNQNVLRPQVPPFITKSVYTSPKVQKFQLKQYENYNNQSREPFQPTQISSFPNNQPSYYSQNSNIQNKRFQISQSEQIITMPWVQDIKVTFSKTIYPDHNTILCALIINNTYLVTGGKDSLINVFTLDGMKIATLKAHTASVCTLSTINESGKTKMLVSGSDVGCSTLIFWDINTWTIKSKIHAHSAAITSIVDLGDGQTLVSGSYDKLINIYNYKRAQVKYNLTANRSNVTGIILSSDGKRMTSCGLDKSLYVWQITRRNGIVQMIQLQRIIQNNQMICSLNSSFLRSQIIISGTKDGKIKFWNLDNGQCEKILTANNSAIIQLVVVERQSKPNYPIILSCSSKDRSLVMTNSQNLVNSLFEVNDKLNIQLGCGIGPKVVFDKQKGIPIIVLVSQSSDRKQVNIFQMEAK